MDRYSPSSTGAFAKTLGSAALLFAIIGCGEAAPPTDAETTTCPTKSRDATLFYGGTILTMDQENKDKTDPYSALLMADGKVAGLGNAADFKDCEIKTQVNLDGRTMMPGFIDPHLHIPLMMAFSAMADLSPCLPEPYYYRLYDDDNGTSLCQYGTKGAVVTGLKWTEDRLKDWLDKHPHTKWALGNGIDPSRFGNSPSEIKGALAFRNAPGSAIDAMLGDATMPAFLLDQSGHLAYVNQQAFVDAGICRDTPCGTYNLLPGVTLPQDAVPPLGTWATETDGTFTGLLKEEGAYKPFMKKISETKVFAALEHFTQDPKALKIVKSILGKISAAGVTTVINGGGFTVSEITLIKLLASSGQTDLLPRLRYRTLMSGTITDKTFPKKSPSELVEGLKFLGVADPDNTWKGDGMFGANGIKFWADGSTQGCTAFVRGDYAGQTICEGHPGNLSSNYTLASGSDPYGFTGKGSIYEAMEPFWKNNWMIQVHTNGDGAMLNTLRAFQNLHAGVNNAYDKSLILIHATVGGEAESAKPVVEQMAAVKADGFKLTASHLAGHVAYWGAAMQNSLDGKGQLIGEKIANDDQGRVALLDAAAIETLKSIPVSFHSDAPVSPVNPLWYVQQMVDRITWVYPDLASDRHQPMPAGPLGAQNVSIYEGLKAITTVPALQNGLEQHIGKLKPDMVADLVILSANPLAQTGSPFGIAGIKVACSYVGGKLAHDGDRCK